ncbi:cell division protein ZapA [Candidatus Erwinia haradaeae]|uniref:Cell division protein ZapA n=1 Tax=Candidatus Erwinia haradaeae TaxID=1922217 RepID=A0A803FUI0_9GAMM|nr:cell division protein ZapA [Candidatus Erwinia haradaeae]VFP88856.1 Cell division protein ZapA [Candidatus Erwinia haradaeae]
MNQTDDRSTQPVDLYILGCALRVKCPHKEMDALNLAAEELSQRLQALKLRTKVTNTEQLVLITALNLCYELAEEKVKTRDYALHMEKRIRSLQKILEQALFEQDSITCVKNPSTKFE